jgi:hypothetical protein
MYTIEKKSIGSGCASSFYRLNGMFNKGFKTFGSYESALIAHRSQTRLAEHSLAPYVYSDVGRVRVGRGKKLSNWGYVTEMAETLGCGGNTCTCGECDRDYIEYEYESAISELCDKMEELGFLFGDNHPGNVGFVYRNGYRIMVCIDTGDESVTSDECYCITCAKGGNCCD